MNPVNGYTMINFIEWIEQNHPEITSLKNADKNLLFRLVNEFENGKLTSNPELKEKWEIGFNYCLFNGNSNWQGHDIARDTLNNFEKSSKNYKDDLIELGIISRGMECDHDFLLRSKTVPFKALFLFTSEDNIFENYIKQNYDALNSLSGDFCDIYLSVDQFFHIENAYDHLAEIDIIKKKESISITDLPGIVFWDKKGYIKYVSFSEASTSSEIMRKIRYIFETIRNYPF